MVKTSLVILSLSTLSPPCQCVSREVLLLFSTACISSQPLRDFCCESCSGINNVKMSHTHPSLRATLAIATADSYWSLIEQQHLMPRGKQWLEPPKLPPQCTSQCQGLSVRARTWDSKRGCMGMRKQRVVQRQMESSFGITQHRRLLPWEARLGKSTWTGQSIW